MSEFIIKKTSDIPMIIIRGLIIFPGALVHFDMVREKSIAALEEAMAGNQKAFLTLQKDITIENPGFDDIEKVGTICRIKQVVKMPNGMVRVLVEGKARARLDILLKSEPYFKASVSELDCPADSEVSETEYEALQRRMIAEFQSYCTNNHKLNPEAIFALEAIENPDEFTDAVASNLQIKLKDKQDLLNTFSVPQRMEKLITILVRETQILEIDNEINRKVKENIEQNQKEYFLREQMKIIQEELGDKDGIGLEIKEYKERLRKVGAPEEVIQKCEQELDRMQKMPYGNPEANVIRNYVGWICDLPWNQSTEDRLDLMEAKKILNRDHYGLEQVKERMLEFLAVRALTKQGESPIICLVGPPGTGKTSIARSVAEALNKKYVRISLGGVRDEAEIRGHRRTYVGSMPGRIVNGLRQAGVKNPLMLLDEVDKVSSDYKGDTASALLEVLDAEQNRNFRDHYVEIPIDLSEVLFVVTANTTETIPRPLLDRMEVIEVSSYTAAEKFHIAREHLMPKQLKKNGMQGRLIVSDNALRSVIEGYTREAGVRGLERKLGEICRKAARELLKEDKSCIRVNDRNLEKYLGKPRFHSLKANQTDEIGIVRGLAWTSVGGDTLQIEVNMMPGKGELELTGQLGDVMKESAMTGLSYIRSVSERYQIDPDVFKKNDFHIHIPEGAVPKDGPSAGITMATALLSALTHTPVRADLAMTGEITLRGRVLPIGGLKEKTLAAKIAGIKTVLVPEKNRPDVEEIPAEIKNGLEILFVETMDDVIAHAFVGGKGNN